jgi:hypothetical protein
MLTTTVECVWALQALIGVEQMPTVLRLKPYIPSAHSDFVVETTQGRQLLSNTAQYHSLQEAGAIDAAGQVDGAVRDWMMVLGRPDREVVLTIRRPGELATDDDGPTVQERSLVVCRHDRYLAMAARDGEQMVIGGVGEASEPAQQVELICRMVVPALGDHPPAEIDGINVPKATVVMALEHAGSSPEARAEALRRLGMGPWEVEVVQAAMDLEQSAMAVIAVVDHAADIRPHPQVLTVADTDYGRISFTMTTGADGQEWLSIFPTTPTSLRQDLGELLAAPQLV